jgi:hypothetical protein
LILTDLPTFLILNQCTDAWEQVEEAEQQKRAAAKRKLKDATAAAASTNEPSNTSTPTESFDEIMRHKLREKQQSLEKSRAPSDAESEQAKCAAAPYYS